MDTPGSMGTYEGNLLADGKAIQVPRVVTYFPWATQNLSVLKQVGEQNQLPWAQKAISSGFTGKSPLLQAVDVTWRWCLPHRAQTPGPASCADSGMAKGKAMGRQWVWVEEAGS